MRSLLLLLTLLAAAPASAQWTRIDTNYGVADAYATNLVGADASHLMAAVLAGQPVPNRFVILRSADDGETWAETFSGFNGGVRGTFLGQIEGQMALLVTGGGLTAILLSDDSGATWTETAARIPSSQTTSIARIGTTYIVVGSNPSYRSTDGGASWSTLGENQQMSSVLTFRGRFYALSSIGQLHQLDGDAWTLVNFGSPFATNLWVEGIELWVKASASSLYASSDGAAWSAETTTEPTQWGRVIAAPDDGAPWFLHNQSGALDLLLSDDDGATGTSIADGYPRDANNAICLSNYAVTPSAVIGNAWACSFTDQSQNGVFRYTLGPGPIARADGPETQSLAIELANPTQGGSPVTIRQLEAGDLAVMLFDALGRRVASLIEATPRAGETVATLPQGLAPGVYVVRAVSGEQVASRTFTTVR
ncbi:MAG: hypothetical protein Rubg2KO_10680 [Rubricoccaceae bacterium]